MNGKKYGTLEAFRAGLEARAKPVYMGEVGLTAPPNPPYCRSFATDYSTALCSDRLTCLDMKLSGLFALSQSPAGALVWQAISGASNCYDVGRVQGGWDLLDGIVAKYVKGNTTK